MSHKIVIQKKIGGRCDKNHIPCNNIFTCVMQNFNTSLMITYFGYSCHSFFFLKNLWGDKLKGWSCFYNWNPFKTSLHGNWRAQGTDERTEFFCWSSHQKWSQTINLKLVGGLCSPCTDVQIQNNTPTVCWQPQPTTQRPNKPFRIKTLLSPREDLSCQQGDALTG